jgi:hypothetical protein
MHPQLAALRRRALGLEGALPQRRHLEVAHDPLEPEQQPIVDHAWVIDAVVIDQHDLRNRAELHQLRPVAIFARIILLHRNRGCVLVLLAQPELATMAHAALHEKGLAVQRMPRIVDRDLLSVVGGM